MKRVQFKFDFISVVPFELIIIVTHRWEHIVLYRMITRVFRIFRVNAYSSSFQSNIRLNSSAIALISLFGMILIFSHWVACCWYAISLTSVGTGFSWVDEKGSKN